MKTIHPNTSFNTLQYIVPVFNTSDVLEDVLDVLTSNTSFNTSQYILLIFGYIPIHPACIGMYWMLIHPIHPSIHPPRFANDFSYYDTWDYYFSYYFSYYDTLFFIIFPIIFNYDRVSAH
jgi:hypothetical protein